MEVLIASTPAAGHLNPLLAIGRILIAEGHEIVGLSGSASRERIESIGAKFRPLPAGADFRDMVAGHYAHRWRAIRHCLTRAIKPPPCSTIIATSNFLGDESGELVRAAFGSNYGRLVELKTKYDPTNFFSLNQNVEPRR